MKRTAAVAAVVLIALLASGCARDETNQVRLASLSNSPFDNLFGPKPTRIKAEADCQKPWYYRVWADDPWVRDTLQICSNYDGTLMRFRNVHPYTVVRLTPQVLWLRWGAGQDPTDVRYQLTKRVIPAGRLSYSDDYRLLPGASVVASSPSQITVRVQEDVLESWSAVWIKNAVTRAEKRFLPKYLKFLKQFKQCYESGKRFARFGSQPMEDTMRAALGTEACYSLASDVKKELKATRTVEQYADDAVRESRRVWPTLDDLVRAAYRSTQIFFQFR